MRLQYRSSNCDGHEACTVNIDSLTHNFGEDNTVLFIAVQTDTEEFPTHAVRTGID